MVILQIKMNVPFNQHQNMVNLQKLNSANLVKNYGLVLSDVNMAFYLLVAGICYLICVTVHIVNLVQTVYWFELLEDFVIFP